MLPILVAIALNSKDLLPRSISRPETNAAHGSNIQRTDTDEIADIVEQQFAAWNRRDIDGYMKAFWASPLLVFAVEGEVWIGWNQVRANLLQEYSDTERMGNSILERLQTNIVSPETATTVEWWSIAFHLAKVRGFTTSAWHKFPDGWRIIQGHTSVLEAQ
jgi:hypothetical protein